MSQSPSLRFRFLYAYRVSAQVFGSYLLLWAARKLFGASRLEKQTAKVHERNAKRILKAILRLKGLFIKVGQMLSILTTFLPEVLTQELEGLQDAVPAHPYDKIEKRFIEEFQKTPDQLFKSFEKTPIASASLGQVHAAVMSDGTRVAVKVQYPEIEEIVRIDLKTLKRIFGFLHLLFPNYGLRQIYSEVASIVSQELSFSAEGKNLERIGQNFQEETDFLFPKVYWNLSSERVLTLQFMEGIKISNLEALKSLKLNPSEVASKIIHAYCRQIFIDGLYHADPHPGNFMVSAEGKIIFMDFGAVARISENMRRGVAKFIEGIIRRDNRVISQAMKEMGFIAKEENEEVFDRLVEFFYDRLKDLKLEDIKQLNLSNVGNLEDLIEFKRLDVSLSELLQTFNVPKDWALMERALILLFALTQHLDANLNPLSIIIPYAEEFVLGKDRKFGDLVLEAVKEVLLSYLRLPSELERVLRKMNQGELEIGVKQTRGGFVSLGQAIHRLNLTLLCFGSGILGYILYREQIPQFQYPLYAASFFGIWIVGSLLRK